jgi:hypothetical protein
VDYPTDDNMLTSCLLSRFTFTHKNVRRFYRSGFDLGDAFEGLSIPVKKFQIYGDLPGEVIDRLNRKFGVGVTGTHTKKEGSDRGPTPATSSTATSSPAASNASTAASPKPTTPRDPTGQSRNDVAHIAKSLADKNPEDKEMMKLADDLARMPIRSREVNAMLFGPPTPEEMERVRRQMQK